MPESHRVLYSAALQERRDAYRMAGVTVRYGDQPGRVKDIRRSHPDQARWSFSPQQATLARLNRAFEAFFRRVKAGAKPGLPRFERASWFDTLNAALNILRARLARHTAQAA
jgi:putative transposase